MGEFTDKLKAAGNEAVGKIKQVVGDATDRPDVQAEGVAQEGAGKVQSVKGDVKGALGDKI